MAFDHINTEHAPSEPTHFPWSPSADSTTSSTSSSSSTFSIDAPSSHSSASSTLDTWSSSTWNNENDTRSYSSHQNQHWNSRCTNAKNATTSSAVCSKSRREQSGTEVIPPESRQHPRRTQRLNSDEFQSESSVKQCPRPPPSLVRQSERKDNFVDSLVDTTTQMIETIWPLSILSCGQDTELGNKQQNLIGLRTFVQEVLRRSKTSYSTLQVALYYLILVQSCIPKHDFTMEQSEDSPACRAMQCGRRMFLAALILASKYLQDRNFSARAWSKISGLGTCEINANEMAFLRAVDWKLHIPEPVFHRWTDIVLKYSPSAQFNTPPRSSPRTLRCWKTIIPMLTPDLDTVEFGHAELSETDSGYDSPGSDMSPPPIPMHEDMSTSSGSNEPTPTNPYTIPRVLEPTPRDTNTNEQILPPLPKLGPLPTPQLTPRTGAFCTPAVSASGLCPKRPSMCYAMGRIQDSVFARTTLDRVCDWKPKVSETFPTPSRRPSLARSASSMSSPESMISDRSSRSSRSSSISSIASSNCALQQPRLAVQATRRCANMHLSDLKEENQPAIICESPGVGLSWEEFTAKHEPNKPKPVILVGAREILESTRRAMAESQRNISTCEAAAALRDMRLNRRSMVSQPTPPETPRSRKRSRTSSIDLSLPSAAVSAACDLLAPRCLGDITNMKKRNEEDKTVLPDENVADSFLLRDEYRGENTTLSLPPFDTYKRVKPSTAKPLMSQEGLPNKRTCAGSDRGGRDEARMIERLMRQSDGMSRPGMWAGRL